MPSDSASGPRYAPEDPTLPEPWKGLVDGKTGYIYYWNPETNVTQYEKPVKEKSKKAVSSSVHREERFENQGGRQNNSRLYNGSGNNTCSSREPAKARGSSYANGSLSAEAYCRKNEITVFGDNVPPPYITFESTGFPAEILKEVHKAGFTAPMPIQAQSWPIALQSRDVVAIAKTGSGKTLGYLIPGFIHLKRLRNNPRMGPTVLVLAPTRELATQIQDEADKFGRSSRISCTCIYGGAPKIPQLRDLDRGVDVVVATPGRLNDILEMRRINLQQVSYLVLDEADRMLDMGFEPQIRKIVKEIPNRRQTLMYTATWPKEVRKIAADLLVDPVQVNIGNIDELVANKAITQYVEVIKPTEKQRRLEQILRSQEPGSKVIIFCSTKKMCDQLARALARQFGAAAIHGDKNQNERDRVLGNFKTGRSPILVATDVAARGLDIKDIRIVINFDFPTGVEDYVHRIGRTGRAGATGVSYTFFSDQDSKYARELVKVLEGADQRVPSQLWDMVARGGYGGKSRRWGPVACDQGRPNGIVRPGYGGGGVRGMPFPSSRLDGDRGVNHTDRVSRDRYSDDCGYQASQLRDTRVGRRSFSRSPRAETGGHLDINTMPSGCKVRSRSISRSLSPSPKRARIGSGRRGSRSNSPSLCRNGRLHVRKQREPSYDDGEIRDDLSPRAKKVRSRSPGYSRNRYMKERSRSPIHSRDDRLDREKSRFPYAENGRVEGSYSPPNFRKGAEKLPVVRSQPLFYNGEEVEEGMILPDEEEGMISQQR